MVLAHDLHTHVRVSLSVIEHCIGDDGVVLFTLRDNLIIIEARPRGQNQIPVLTSPIDISTVKARVFFDRALDSELTCLRIDLGYDEAILARDKHLSG